METSTENLLTTIEPASGFQFNGVKSTAADMKLRMETKNLTVKYGEAIGIKMYPCRFMTKGLRH